IAVYLRSLPAVSNAVAPRDIPFPLQPAPGASQLQTAPQGRTTERASYLMNALVGCKECHSHHDKSGKLNAFVGGDPVDPYEGTFGFGPHLPLRQSEKGFATFPYPGFAVLYGSNLTRYGMGGPEAHVSADDLVRMMQTGITPRTDNNGRPE